MLLIVRRFSIIVGIALGLAPAIGTSQDNTIWSCRDKDGHTHVTNLKEDTVGMNCRIVQQTRVQVVPTQKPSSRPGAGTPPTAFPKEDSEARASARDRQREILEKELKPQESIRSGDERNYARALERLQPYKDSVDLHQKNVESLKRELNNLYR